LGWFAQRKIRKDILKLHGNLSKNGLGLAVQACRSLALAEMLSEVAANCSDPEKTILFQRFIANLKKKMGSSLILFDVNDLTEILSNRDAGLGADPSNIESFAEIVAGIFQLEELEQLVSGLALALRDSMGSIEVDKRKLLKAIRNQFGYPVDGDSESSCPNCGSFDFEITSEEELGSISRPKEFIESTTRGTRTKVLKVIYDKKLEFRRCQLCTETWKFKTEMEA
jgi:hypothetical protein